MKNLEQLDAYRHGRQLAVDVYRLTQLAPLAGDRGMVGQMRRAAVSIPSNIAEAFALGTRAQLVRGLRIAMGSTVELSTQSWIAHRAGMMPANPLAEHIVAHTERELSMLVGLLKRFGARPNQHKY